MYKCDQCEKEFETSVKLGGHLAGMIKSGKHKSENKKPENTANEEWKKENGKYECPHCQKEYSKNGIGNHIWRKHGSGINHKCNSGYKKGRITWNKGLTKESSEIINKQSKKLSNKYKTGIIKHHGIGKKRSLNDNEKQRKTINEKIKNGTWHNSFSKSRTIKYKNINFLGSWEVKFAQWLDEQNIKWERVNKSFDYVLNNIKRKYTPDFYLVDDDVYVEIKGYPTKKDFAKWDNFPNTLSILSGPMLKELGLKIEYKTLNIVYKNIKW